MKIWSRKGGIKTAVTTSKLVQVRGVVQK